MQHHDHDHLPRATQPEMDGGSALLPLSLASFGVTFVVATVVLLFGGA